jgi:hypothetical protein
MRFAIGTTVKVRPSAAEHRIVWAAGPARAARFAPYVTDHEGVTSPLTRHVAEAERHTLVKAAGGRAW